MFGNNHLVEDEQSDLEYLEVQNEEEEIKKHNKDEALNMFRYIIKNNIEKLEKAFI